MFIKLLAFAIIIAFAVAETGYDACTSKMEPVKIDDVDYVRVVHNFAEFGRANVTIRPADLFSVCLSVTWSTCAVARRDTKLIELAYPTWETMLLRVLTVARMYFVC